VFTGVVKELGTVEAIERSDAGARLKLSAGFAQGLGDGDSVAVAGVCLTVTSHTESSFTADVMNQSLELTNLGSLEPGASVNLEPALNAGDPLGGHIVQGHVDCAGEVARVTPDGIATRLEVGVPERFQRYFVEHGSVTVDGVSLTVARLTDDGFEVSLIPETLERTTLGNAKTGDKVNLEFDVIARYVERLLRLDEKGTSHE
jgi:riboflavin synthase